jgi:hypothetical protein
MRKPALLIIIGFLLGACSSEPLPNRDPVGEVFPSVAGESLAGESVALPADLEGQAAILIVGYLQEAQFDIDRWLMGLIQAGVALPILELPTIPDLVPTLASGWIDDGMRSGIPEEDWAVVVTLYGPAAKPVAALTGTEKGRLARVLLLNSTGTVVWFHDRGFSASKAIELAGIANDLAASD